MQCNTTHWVSFGTLFACGFTYLYDCVEMSQLTAECLLWAAIIRL